VVFLCRSGRDPNLEVGEEMLAERRADAHDDNTVGILLSFPKNGRLCAFLGRKPSMCYDSAIDGTLLPVAEKTRSIKKLPCVPLRFSFTTTSILLNWV
jgi:hypothetical protein